MTDKTEVKATKKFDWLDALTGLKSDKKGRTLNVLHTRTSHELVTLKEHDLVSYSPTNKRFVFNRNFSLDLRKDDELPAELAPRTWKIVDILGREIAQKNKLGDLSRVDREIEINVNLYAYWLGYDMSTRNGRRRGREAVLEHLMLIKNMSIKQETYIDHRTIETQWTDIIDQRTEITTGKSIKSLRIKMAQSYIETQIMLGFVLPLPVALFQIDDRHPFAYALGRALCVNNHMEKNLKAGREDFMSVAALLKYCRDIPEKDELNHRNWRKSIIMSFKNGLDVLQKGGVLKEWKLCNSAREDLGHGELNFCTLDQFYEYYIQYTLEHMPDKEARLIELAEKEKEREKKRKAQRKPKAKKKAG